jgi:hypothetical protein
MRERVERFEELVAWKKSRALNAAVYQATNSGGLARDLALRSQMRRAAI